jgi:hypothetical protein
VKHKSRCYFTTTWNHGALHADWPLWIHCIAGPRNPVPPREHPEIAGLARKSRRTREAGTREEDYESIRFELGTRELVSSKAARSRIKAQHQSQDACAHVRTVLLFS